MHVRSMGALLQQIRHSYRHRRALACLLVGWLLPACAPAPIFPPDVRDKPDRTVTFESLVANPDHYHDRTVELGGQIVGSSTDQDEVQMLVRELPIRATPVYGPVDTGRLNGMFVIRFTGKIGAQDLQDGNMVVVIGAVMGRVATNLTGTPVRRLTVTAECFHIWRTQGNPIEDFPWTTSGRYVPLIQQTYCVNRPNIILPVS
ncbi:MAG: Slp family lipoprotein [Nitrospirales bacterium]